MPRTKGGVKHAKKKKKVMKAAKGFRGGFGTIYRSAIEFTMRAKRYATRDRKQKKRHFRTLWVQRLAAALRERGIAYNRFIPAAVAAGVELNRKMLSELAINDPAAFDAVVALVKPHIVTPAPKKAATAAA
ncbi:MAG TPA: 50S ribosomal protein L20 [Humisphaera sp.]